MAGFTPAALGRVFTSQRRAVADLLADWLYERLVARSGRDQVFDDVARLDSVDEFVEVIANTVRACDVLLTPVHRAVEHDQVIARQFATDCPRIRM